MSIKVCVTIESPEHDGDNGNGEPTPVPPTEGVRTYSETIGDGSALEYMVHHNLGTQDVLVQLRDLATGDINPTGPRLMSTDGNTITVVCEEAPAADAYRVTVFAAPDESAS